VAECRKWRREGLQVDDNNNENYLRCARLPPPARAARALHACIISTHSTRSLVLAHAPVAGGWRAVHEHPRRPGAQPPRPARLRQGACGTPRGVWRARASECTAERKAVRVPHSAACGGARQHAAPAMAGGATAAASSSPPAASPVERRRSDAFPLAGSLRRDLRALSADLTRLALGGEEGDEEELPPSPADSDEETATSASEAESAGGRGAPEPDAGTVSSSDESRFGQGLKARARRCCCCCCCARRTGPPQANCWRPRLRAACRMLNVRGNPSACAGY
jgi:hypothetical protein